MAGKSVPVVFVPRFTSYVGGGLFYGIPIPVAAYDVVVVDFWHGVINGVGLVGMNLHLEESTDCSRWDPTAGTAIPSPYTPAVGEDQFRHTLTKAWFRLGIELMGSGVAVTCWASGFFELRER